MKGKKGPRIQGFMGSRGRTKERVQGVKGSRFQGEGQKIGLSAYKTADA